MKPLPLRLALGFALCLLVGGGPAGAQLALIREGRESAGQPEPGDGFGTALAVGDFDGDGFQDLATGAPYEKYGNLVEEAGAVVINYGSRFGLTWKNALLLTPNQSGLSTARNNHFGLALAAGDFDGDGFDDLAVGAPLARLGANDAAGVVAVYRGSREGLVPTATAFSEAQFGGATEANDQFGAVLSAGRLGTDNYADLVVGAPGEDAGVGAIFVLRGSSTGLKQGAGFYVRPRDLGVQGGIGDNFGASLAIGNIHGGASPEVIVGAPGTDVGLIPNAGRIYVLTGGIGTVLTNAVQSFDLGDTDDFYSANARFGHSLAVGSFRKGSDHRDLAVGAPGLHGGAGRVFVARGQLLGVVFDQSITPKDDLLIQAEVDRGGFGFALAAGDINGDGIDDLAVGAPEEDNELFGAAGVDTGLVSFFLGTALGLRTGDTNVLWQTDLGEMRNEAGRLGHALVFGRVSATPPPNTARQSLLLGAPARNVGSGEVFDRSPWRQVGNPLCESALSVNCDGDVVFALRPFATVHTASTAKIMTVLLACEAALRPAGDAGHVPLDQVYTVPPEMLVKYPWGSSCSTYKFFVGERISFGSLLHATIKPSGNDAAVALADVMTHGADLSASVDNFLPRMNAKAEELGMNDTEFVTVSGTGETVSTAWDMYLLARFAMKNELFAATVGNLDYSFARFVPASSLLAMGINTPLPPGALVAFPFTLSYGWLKNRLAEEPRAIGVKPGSTPEAGSTAVLAGRPAAQSTELAYATGFGWRSNLAGKRQSALLTLALDYCLGDPVVDGPGSFLPASRPDVFPDEAEASLAQVTVDLEDSFDAPLTTSREARLRLDLSGTTSTAKNTLTLLARHDLMFSTKPKEIVVVGARGVSGHGGVTIRNAETPSPGQLAGLGTGKAVTVVVRSKPEIRPEVAVTLAPDQAIELPRWRGAPGTTTDLTWEIEVLGTTEAYLVVDIHSYEFEVALGGTTPREVECAILRPPNALRDALDVLVAAEHPAAADQTVGLIVRDPNDARQILPTIKRLGAVKVRRLAVGTREEKLEITATTTPDVALVLESAATLGPSPRWKAEMDVRSDAAGQARAVLAHDVGPARFFRYRVAP